VVFGFHGDGRDMVTLGLHGGMGVLGEKNGGAWFMGIWW